MIIGINALSVMPGVSGGGETYVVNIIEKLCIIGSNNTYVLFVNKYNEGIFPCNNNILKVLCPVSKKYLILRVLWEQFVLPFYARKYRIDIFFSPSNMSPIIGLRSKSVLQVCDLYWANYREAFSVIEYMALKYLILLSINRADKIIAISNFTKDEIIQHTKTDKRKIVIINQGKGNPLEKYMEADKETNAGMADCREKYILAVSRTHEHKNYLRLIEAFKIIIKNNPDYKLIIAGIEGRQHKTLIKKIKDDELTKDVLLTGWIDDYKLYKLYKNATIFVFPSLYEGFGYPLLEAMSFGIPIACSNVSALPEVGGDAVLCFDPYSIEDIADKISMLIVSEQLRRKLINNGYERAKIYTWENAARKTLELFNEVAKNV